MNQGNGRCTGCGATLPPFMQSDGRVRCGACDTLNAAEPPQPYAGPPAGGFGVPRGGYGPPPGMRGALAPIPSRGGFAGITLALGLTTVVLCGVGAAVVLLRPRALTLPLSNDSPAAPARGLTGAGGGSWEGVHGAILTDVDGDGIPDVVGRVRYVSSGDVVALAAFQGASGKKLWESESLGTYGEALQAALGLVEDDLVVARPNGDTLALGLRDGTKRWKGSVPEKTRRVCKGDQPGEARLLLADQTMVDLRLADGHASAPVAIPKTGEKCVRVWSDDRALGSGDPSFEGRMIYGEDPKVDGMRGSVVLQRAGGPKVVLGTRAKGTSVPMVAAIYDNASLSWKSDLPGSRPLETSSSGSECAALTTSRLFTEYGFTSGGSTPHEVVAFDLNGHRLWEVALPTDMPLEREHDD